MDRLDCRGRQERLGNEERLDFPENRAMQDHQDLWVKEVALVQRAKKGIKAHRGQKDQQEELEKPDRMGPLELRDLQAGLVGWVHRDRPAQQEETGPEVLVVSLVNLERLERQENLEMTEKTAREATVVKKVQRAQLVLLAHLESPVNEVWLA